jgi:hypothetical protein
MGASPSVPILRLGLFADTGTTIVGALFTLTWGWDVSKVGHAAQKIARRKQVSADSLGDQPVFLPRRERGTGGTPPQLGPHPSSVII